MADGTILRTLHWEAADEPWAVAEIVHGLGEHGGRYGTVAEALTRRRHRHLVLRPARQRRLGRSAWPRGQLVDPPRRPGGAADLASGTRIPGKPLVLYGHSLGGLVACGYVLCGLDRPLPDVLVLSAPALDDNQPGWQRPMARLLTGVVPKLQLANRVPDAGRSRDPAVSAKVNADPLCGRTSTVRTGAEAFKEQDRLRALLAGLESMPVPTYVLHGSADPIVPAPGDATSSRARAT